LPSSAIRISSLTFDTGNCHEDVYYIAMEYLEAGTLKERIKAGLTPGASS
jgi:hypothetical protein